MAKLEKDEDPKDELILSESPTPDSSTDSEPEVTKPEPAPKPEPAKVDPELKPRPANTYVLKQGDDPSKVAMDIYGRHGAARELVIKNMGSKWQAGDIINLL